MCASLLADPDHRGWHDRLVGSIVLVRLWDWEYAIYVTERTVSSLAKQTGRPPSFFTPDRRSEGTGITYVRIYDFWTADRHVIAAGGRVLYDAANEYGFIPYLIARNVGPAEYVWGLSDQQFFESLAEYYNVLISRIRDIEGAAFSTKGIGYTRIIA